MQNLFKSISLLVIEDNPGDFILLDEYLRDRFDEVKITRANTFKEATVILQAENSFQTILLDLSLPDKHGEQLVKEVVKLAKDIPVIVLTGYADIQFSVTSLSFGVADYLLKDDLQPDTIYKSIVYTIERTKVVNLLQQSEKKYSSLFQLSPQPMWVYHPETLQIIEVNEAAEKTYGYTHEDFLQMIISHLFAKNEFEKLLNRCKDNSSDCEKTKQEVVYNHITKFGNKLLVNILLADIEYNNIPCVLMVAHNVTEQTLLKRSLEEAYANIVSIEEQERERFAAEIHDGLTQNLIAMKVYFSFLRNTMEKENQDFAESINNLLEKSIRDCKDIVSNIRPKALIDNGLFAGLADLIRNISDASGIKIIYDFDFSVEPYFDFNAQLNIYRIVQECFNNLLKHSNATHAELYVFNENNKMKIVFADDGVGISEDVLQRHSSFLSMKRRTALLSGRFQVQNNAQKGVSFTFTFPIHNNLHSAKSF